MIGVVEGVRVESNFLLTLPDLGTPWKGSHQVLSVSVHQSSTLPTASNLSGPIFYFFIFYNIFIQAVLCYKSYFVTVALKHRR